MHKYFSYTKLRILDARVPPSRSLPCRSAARRTPSQLTSHSSVNRGDHNVTQSRRMTTLESVESMLSSSMTLFLFHSRLKTYFLKSPSLDSFSCSRTGSMVSQPLPLLLIFHLFCCVTLAESGPYCHSRMFGCLDVCLFVRASGRWCCCVAAAVLLRSRLLRSSSKVKAGQWVTPNPTRPTILVRIC